MSLPAPAPYRLTFGRFKGSTLAECREDYLLWLSDFAPSPALRLLARKHLGIDVVVQEDESIPNESAAVRFPLVCFQWEETMVGLFGDDPATDAGTVVCRGRAVLRQLRSEVTSRPWPEAADIGRFPQEGGAV
ncbi:hypothetical protein [Gemmata massiliana]|nr:hypothetical protein [Gemmata massiliana]